VCDKGNLVPIRIGMGIWNQESYCFRFYSLVMNY